MQVVAQTQVPSSPGGNARPPASRRIRSPRRLILLTTALATALVAAGIALLTSNQGTKGSNNALGIIHGDHGDPGRPPGPGLHPH